ncbi:DUF2793 domain-containing protein [Mesorhizobium australicum]|uniref:DUF2793 domain-containing protein n=1 Tax=Mesorhizobium australicum TaxID=536018 RepID=A0A1X7NYZ1_9HYPH|nr:DUF2793 domain-containing protein [Mesorhizobium australicum]SMH42589.1 Protein of unknown function [Mesorhizobium australicum]
MTNSPQLQLPYIAAEQAQKHVTHNTALRKLDALVQLSVRDRDLTAPPGAPSDGDRYIVAGAPTGAWAGQAGKIAAWQDGAWQFFLPREGWVGWVDDEDVLVYWTGAAWAKISATTTGALPDSGGTGIGVYSFVTAAFTPQAPVSGTAIHMANEGAQTRFLFDNYLSGAGGNIITGRKARGTAAAPSALVLNDNILSFHAFGRGATGYSANPRGFLNIAAAETWTDSAQGTKLSVGLTAVGAAAATLDLLTLTTTEMNLDGAVAVTMGGAANVVIDTNRLFRLRSYTVAALPTPGTVGRMAFASNCRVFNGAGTQEGAGAGSGGLVVDNGTAWKIAGTNVTAVA